MFYTYNSVFYIAYYFIIILYCDSLDNDNKIYILLRFLNYNTVFTHACRNMYNNDSPSSLSSKKMKCQKKMIEVADITRPSPTDSIFCAT